MEHTPPTTAEFQELLWDFYTKHGRDLPWRRPEPDGSYDPYKILVSEMMLQQTQVPRVIPKYLAFLEVFPTVKELSRAELGQVLRQWSGLGYNRRAKFLHETAQTITNEHKGNFPKTLNMLTKLPGIGQNTAGAILAYAFNQPSLFVETNIRTVFIHHFFKDQSNIPDSDILRLLAETLDEESPREFYWALMDYGTHLKSKLGNLTHNSKHYSKQSAFHGSKRQVRGKVIKLLAQGDRTKDALGILINDERVELVLADLLHEGLIRQKADNTISLA
jgi:A/G-specific adenine glycosylase